LHRTSKNGHCRKSPIRRIIKPTNGGFVMPKRRYTRVQELLPKIKEMISAGWTHREIEAHFQLEGDQRVHNLLKRERRKERKAEAGIMPRLRGRPRKDNAITEKGKEYEIKRLKMENELLRDFLHAVGRK
ncbi:MAG TPA: hypothetical protein VN626_01200, partial [Clostridia bacterium]|nr:hypothetical protein [Clostridia bacterium]